MAVDMVARMMAMSAEGGSGSAVQSDWEQTDTTAADYIKNKPSIPSGVVVDQVYDGTSANAQSGVAIAGALSDKVDKVTGKGLSTNDYTTAEKDKLAGIASGAEVNVQSDWSQSDSSADDYIKNKPDLATVATSGSYADLTNKPTIPAAQVNADWNQTTTTAADYIKNKPTLGAAAACGVDTAPASGSTNLITSGAVYTVVGDINTVLEEVL